VIALLAVVAALFHNGSVAYVRCCGADTGIYVGTRLVYRAAHDDAPLTPAWSPSGKSIAFAPGSPLNGIWVMNASGAARRRVTKTGDEPTWSTDGTKIAFADKGAVWVVAANGSGLRRLASGSSPAWAPDDSAILFARGRDVWRMRTNGTGQTALIRNARFPVWSPGATHVAFLRGSSVWIAARNGTGAKPVPGTTSVAQFAWSPDGRLLVTASIDRGDLTVLATNGSNAHPLTNDGGNFNAWPTWQRVH
jgi:Tol biopolymer transport system component